MPSEDVQPRGRVLHAVGLRRGAYTVLMGARVAEDTAGSAHRHPDVCVETAAHRPTEELDARFHHNS